MQLHEQPSMLSIVIAGKAEQRMQRPSCRIHIFWVHHLRTMGCVGIEYHAAGPKKHAAYVKCKAPRVVASVFLDFGGVYGLVVDDAW